MGILKRKDADKEELIKAQAEYDNAVYDRQKAEEILDSLKKDREKNHYAEVMRNALKGK